MTIKYGSLCSGIEAATVAWHDLGWQPQFFSDIEKFPNAVLEHHYPDVPNHGDMTNFGDWPDESIDLLVGGTPCQSFSVAGLRKGLDDPRGNLALTYLAIAERYAPRWLVWENVPGVLSSRGGRDFGSFLGALGKLGYGFAYRVLDAQFFGVAQRRRRVFVVGYLGDWRRAAAVLFERTSLRRDIAPSREAGKETARDFVPSVANCLETTSHDYSRADGFNMIAQPVAIAENTIGRQPMNGGNGNGFTVNGPMYTLNSTGVHGVAGYIHQDTSARRLTPKECERLQGFPDGYTDIYENTPDTPRYKALGNSMAVPVMNWIGEKINKVDKI